MINNELQKTFIDFTDRLYHHCDICNISPLFHLKIFFSKSIIIKSFFFSSLLLGFREVSAYYLGLNRILMGSWPHVPPFPPTLDAIQIKTQLFFIRQKSFIIFLKYMKSKSIEISI